MTVYTTRADDCNSISWSEFRKQITTIAMQAPRPEGVAPVRHRTILARKLRYLTRGQVVDAGHVPVWVEADDC